MSELINVYDYYMRLSGRNVTFISQQIHQIVTLIPSLLMSPIRTLNPKNIMIRLKITQLEIYRQHLAFIYGLA